MEPRTCGRCGSEFGDVCTRDEGSTSAGEHDRLDRRIGQRLRHAIMETLPHTAGEWIDGRIVDRHERDITAYFVMNRTFQSHFL